MCAFGMHRGGRYLYVYEPDLREGYTFYPDFVHLHTEIVNIKIVIFVCGIFQQLNSLCTDYIHAYM